MTLFLNILRNYRALKTFLLRDKQNVVQLVFLKSFIQRSCPAQHMHDKLKFDTFRMAICKTKILVKFTGCVGNWIFDGGGGGGIQYSNL